MDRVVEIGRTKGLLTQVNQSVDESFGSGDSSILVCGCTPICISPVE